MEMNLDKPLPQPTPVTAPFWEGLRERRIRVQYCLDCDQWVFYPRSRCSHCLSERLEWRDVAGDATLYTFTIARQPTAPHFADEVPQLLAVVELTGGIRMTSTLVHVAEADIHVGMRLKAWFDPVSDQVTLLRFEPAS
ncbi:MAG: Zn-ribbon domain-containing OB-fold protein [Pseudomonadales bacterium]